MSNRFYRIAGVLVGVGMILLGLYNTTADEVTCGGRVLEQGGRCTTIHKGGGSTERTYDQQKSLNKRKGIIVLLVGAGLGVGSFVAFRGPRQGR
ncbi:hypothetical protein AB0873_31550 [Micromonospora sp. NPDC047707]|uniref:hypothetical protein n=1 Tax=Micromonospora sp. NPDC047707 TaxID=3154498 RepID=UPI003454ECE4